MSHTTIAMSAARKLLTAGQARADRELSRIEAEAARCGGLAMAYEAGTLRGLVRNLCAELAAYEPEDGSIEVWFKGGPLHVHPEQEMVQANGYDISSFLSPDDWVAITRLVEEKQREEAERARDDAAAAWYAERAA